MRSFRHSGGVGRGHDLASRLAGRSGMSIGALARWVVEAEVVHFDWQHDTWFPLFQSGGPRMLPRTGVSRVLSELRGVLDPWDTAQRFAIPLETLSGRSPADAMALDPDRVPQAARCHRYRVDA